MARGKLSGRWHLLRTINWGTALTLHDPVNGDFTVVIDTANGQLLAQLNGVPPIPPGCAHVSGTGMDVAECGSANSVFISSSDVTVFISAGPTNTEPTPRGYVRQRTQQTTAPLPHKTGLGEPFSCAALAKWQRIAPLVAERPVQLECELVTSANEEP